MISRDHEHLNTELATPQLGNKNKRISRDTYEEDLTRQLLGDSDNDVEAIKEEDEDDKSSQQKQQLPNSNSIGDGLFSGMSKLKKVRNTGE